MSVSAKVVRFLKTLTDRRRHSMEQRMREFREAAMPKRRSVLTQIEEGWIRQTRRPTAGEVDAWIAYGRS
jgi:hypothetical protein